MEKNLEIKTNPGKNPKSRKKNPVTNNNNTV